jgi:hypothetical protein
MSRKTKTKTSIAPPSTGASTAPHVDWHLIQNPLGDSSSEDVLIDHLVLNNYAVEKAGGRNQRYDLEVLNTRWVKAHSVPQIAPGRYEVKKLYRRSRSSSIDRRIKVGSRGEAIYGRYDALIKSLALSIEELIDDNWNGGVKQLEDLAAAIDDALSRRHSHDFFRRFCLLAEAYEDVFGLKSATAFLEHGGIQGSDIIRGFSDIDGVFVMVSGAAGDYFTLVSREELPRLFTFDSVSVEGVKLRFQGEGPIET